MKTITHPHMTNTLTAILQQLGECNTKKINEKLRGKVLTLIGKVSKDVSEEVRIKALQAWTKN